MYFPIIDVYEHPHFGDSVRYENYVELQERVEALEARLAEVEAQRDVAIECVRKINEHANRLYTRSWLDVKYEAAETLASLEPTS